MKKVSNLRKLIEYVTIMMVTYLIMSGIIALIGDYSYRKVLCHPGQIGLFMFVYSWIPLFRLADIEEDEHHRHMEIR